MESQSPDTADSSQLVIIQQKLAFDSMFRNGVNWFYWIAGLSLINTITYWAGISITFVIGLGATQFADGFTSALMKEVDRVGSIISFVGFALSVGIAAIFALFGFLGRKRYLWAIILGMVLYAIDGVILLFFRDFLGAAFHAFALFGIFGGLQALKALTNLEEMAGVESLESIKQRMPTLQGIQVSPAQKRTRLILIGLIVLIALCAIVAYLAAGH